MDSNVLEIPLSIDFAQNHNIAVNSSKKGIIPSKQSTASGCAVQVDSTLFLKFVQLLTGPMINHKT